MYAAFLCFGVALGSTLLALVLSVIFFSRQCDRAARVESETTSLWLAELVSSAPLLQRDALVDHVASELDSLVGLYRSDGAPVRGERIFAMSPSEIGQAISGLLSEVYAEGRVHVVAAAKVPGVSNLAVVVATPMPLLRWHWRWGGPLLWIVGVALGSVWVLGWTAGGGVRAYTQQVGDRLLAMVGDLSSNERRAPSSSAFLPKDNELERAALDLETRFRGELALYRDALDEVQILDEQRTAFLGDVALELEAPLLAILDYSSRLNGGEFGPLSDAQAEDLRIIQQAAQRLLDMVNEVLDLSSLDTEGITFDEQPVDLAAVAREVTRTLRGQAVAKGLGLELELAGETGPFVRGSKRRLWQIVSNLVGNALKFTDSGAVKVTLPVLEDGRIAIVVTDTGAGIPSSDFQSIFDPFRQSGDKSKRRRGSGLGLAICKRLVELHRGGIEVTSELGKGSTFTVRLPALDRREE
ncbi:MAG: HAMP domain-containing histidine kinase [Myxococcota bacterium]|nr:HAMP domain-containing histidine kinase [Myxococcota bacterium]